MSHVISCVCVQQKQKILKKAKKTHKQRVEVSQFSTISRDSFSVCIVQEMNQYLDTLTEHFDIPKVSWTK